MKKLAAVLIVLGLLTAPKSSFAQVDTSPIATPTTTEIPSNKDLKKDWNTLTPEQKAKVKERWQKFKALPPEKKSEIVTARKRFKTLPPEQQTKIRDNYSKWQSMSPEEKAEARQKFRTMRTAHEHKK